MNAYGDIKFSVGIYSPVLALKEVKINILLRPIITLTRTLLFYVGKYINFQLKKIILKNATKYI